MHTVTAPQTSEKNPVDEKKHSPVKRERVKNRKERAKKPLKSPKESPAKPTSLSLNLKTADIYKMQNIGRNGLHKFQIQFSSSEYDSIVILSFSARFNFKYQKQAYLTSKK